MFTGVPLSKILQRRIILKDVLLIDKYGSHLAVKEGLFVVKVREGERWIEATRISPTMLDSIVIAIDGASISSAALMLAGAHGIDVVFIKDFKPICRLIPASYGSSLKVWIKQIRQASSKNRRKELASSFVSGKIHNQIVVLRTFYKIDSVRDRDVGVIKEIINSMEELRIKLNAVEDWKDAGRIEANAAYLYWKGVKKLLPPQLGFKKRLKKWSISPGEQQDSFNIALNIGYSILAKEVWRAIFIANLNPYIGFLHAYRPGRVSLVYDLMEEFRPLAVDRPIIKLARKDTQAILQLKSQDEEAKKKASRTIWKTILEIIREGNPPFREIITTQARRLAYAILNNTEYIPYKARW